MRRVTSACRADMRTLRQRRAALRALALTIGALLTLAHITNAHNCGVTSVDYTLAQVRAPCEMPVLLSDSKLNLFETCCVDNGVAPLSRLHNAGRQFRVGKGCAFVCFPFVFYRFSRQHCTLYLSHTVVCSQMIYIMMPPEWRGYQQRGCTLEPDRHLGKHRRRY